MHVVLTCLPNAAAVQDLQRLFYKKLNCGLSHENEPPSIPLFNLVAPHIQNNIFASRQPNHVKYLLSGLYNLLK